MSLKDYLLDPNMIIFVTGPLIVITMMVVIQALIVRRLIGGQFLQCLADSLLMKFATLVLVMVSLKNAFGGEMRLVPGYLLELLPQPYFSSHNFGFILITY